MRESYGFLYYPQMNTDVLVRIPLRLSPTRGRTANTDKIHDNFTFARNLFKS
jgi:hypothetical protein